MIDKDNKRTTKTATKEMVEKQGEGRASDDVGAQIGLWLA